MPAQKFTFYAHNVVTRTRVAEVPFTTFRYTDTLNNSGSFDGTLPLFHPVASMITLNPGAIVIYVDYDGQLVWAGWVLSNEVQAGPNDYTMRLSGPGLWGYWAKRTVRSRAGTTYATGTAPNEIIWSTVDQFRIVKDTIDHAASIAGTATVPLDAVRAAGAAFTTSGVTRSKTVYSYERKVIAQLVEELAQQTQGFDYGLNYAWDLSGASPVPRQYLDLYYPRRGQSSPIATLEHGGNVSLLRLTRDAANLANPLTAVGAGTADAQLVVEVADTTFLSPVGSYPYTEGQVEFRDWGVEYAGNLTRYANAKFSQSRAPVDTGTFTIKQKATGGLRLGTINLGDTLRAIASIRQFDYDNALLRVMSQTINVTGIGLDSWDVSVAPVDATLGL